MIPDSTAPDFTKLFDIQLMITPDGRSRSPAEYRSILQRSGLEYLGSRSSDQGMFSMVEAENT